jgi:hypothetical protein
MAASLGVNAVSQVWDIRQPVRMLAEDILKIRYQKMTGEDIEGFNRVTNTNPACSHTPLHVTI